MWPSVEVKGNSDGVDHGWAIYVTRIGDQFVNRLAWAGHPLSMQHDYFIDEMGNNVRSVISDAQDFSLGDFPDYEDSATDVFRGNYWDNMPHRRQGGSHSNHHCPDDCKDDAWFADEQEVTCLEWEGLDCDRAVEDWGYSNKGAQQVLTKCCATCAKNRLAKKKNGGASSASGASSTTTAWGTPLPKSNSNSSPRVSTGGSSSSSASANPQPTSAELNSIARAYEKLWQLDNRLVPDQDYEINPQRYTFSSKTTDEASQPLFSYVDESVFERPTFKTFLTLMDHSDAQAGVTETVSKTEQQENAAFLEASLKEPVMKYVYNYLKKKNKVSSESDFKSKLNKLWFNLFRRSGKNDSSGFEHVFVGEMKQDKISGMHNWIQVYQEEQNDRFDYKGYIRPRGGGNADTDEHLLTIRFDWNDVMKPVSSSLIGTTPEFELALFSLCYFASSNPKTTVQFGDEKAKVVCYKNGHGSSEHLGSAWVEDP
jgi:poly(U)-specific endoribonuclease